MSSDLIDRIRTIHEANRIERELMLAKEALYQKGPKYEKTFSSMRSWVREELTKEGEITEKKISEVVDQLKDMPVVYLELGIEPSDEQISNMHGRVVKHIGAPVLLKIVHNPSMVGGAKISYNGKHYDGSLEARMDKLRDPSAGSG